MFTFISASESFYHFLEIILQQNFPKIIATVGLCGSSCWGRDRGIWYLVEISKWKGKRWSRIGPRNKWDCKAGPPWLCQAGMWPVKGPLSATYLLLLQPLHWRCLPLRRTVYRSFFFFHIHNTSPKDTYISGNFWSAFLGCFARLGSPHRRQLEAISTWHC